jgi:hypothetical protein
MKQTPQDILNEILLRMNYDSSKTLSENKELIFEQGTMGPTQHKENYFYKKTIPFNLVSKSSQEYVKNPSNYVAAWKVYPKFEYSEIFPKNADFDTMMTVLQSEKLKSQIFPKVDNKPKTEEDIQEFQDWLDINYPTWYKGGTLNNNVEKGWGTFGPNTTRMWNNTTVQQKWLMFKENRKRLSKLNPVTNKPIQRDEYLAAMDLENKKKAQLIAIKLKDLGGIPEEIDGFYKWFLKFRDIWSSNAAQVIQMAIGIAFGSITAGFGALLVKLIDWGIDGLILFIDLVYALLDLNNQEKWDNVKNSAYTMAMFGVLSGLMKGSKSAGEWLNSSSVKQISNLYNTVSGWFNKLSNFLGNSFSFITKPLNYLKNKFDDILKKFLPVTIASATSLFLFNALPVAGAMYGLLKLNEEKITKYISPLLNSTIGLTLDELRFIAGGPKAWEEKNTTPTTEQFRLAGKVIPNKDTTTIVNIIKLSDEEIKSVKEPTEQFLNEKGKELMDDLKEESMKLANQDLNEYMKEFLKYSDSPCKEFLDEEYKKGNARYVLGGEQGTILMINEIPSAYIFGDPDSIMVNDKNICV